MRWLIAPVAALSLFLLACTDTEPGSVDATVPPAPEATSEVNRDPLNRDATLNSLRDVRDMVVRRVSDFDAELIRNVQFRDNVLTIRLGEELGQGGPGDVQSLCRDVSEAIGFRDVTVVVESPTGSRLAECSLGR